MQVQLVLQRLLHLQQLLKPADLTRYVQIKTCGMQVKGYCSVKGCRQACPLQLASSAPPSPQAALQACRHNVKCLAVLEKKGLLC
jgi:hypothetical protein